MKTYYTELHLGAKCLFYDDFKQLTELAEFIIKYFVDLFSCTNKLHSIAL